MKKSISILGCGWLGMPLGKEMVRLGFEVKGSTRSLSKIKEIESYAISGFIIDIASLSENVFQFLNSDVLIVAITSKSVPHFTDLIRIIKSVKIKNIILISSTSVYDTQNKTVTETSDTNNSVLSQIERLFINASDFKTTIIRFGGLFGGQRKPGNFIKSPFIIKNPEGYINLIHRHDCIQLIIQVIQQAKWGEIFNACASDHPKRKLYYSQEVLKVHGIKPTVDENSKNEFKIISNEKIKNSLNYEFKHDQLLDT